MNPITSRLILKQEFLRAADTILHEKLLQCDLHFRHKNVFNFHNSKIARNCYIYIYTAPLLFMTEQSLAIRCQ